VGLENGVGKLCETHGKLGLALVDVQARARDLARS